MLTRGKREIRRALRDLPPVPAPVAAEAPGSAGPPSRDRSQFELGAGGVSARVAAAGDWPLDLKPLRKVLETRSPAQIKRWVARGEALARARRDPAPPALRTAAPGDRVLVPCHMVRPGQTQISFDRARTQIDKFLDKLQGHAPDEVRALAEAFGLLEAPGDVAPRGKAVYLTDRNHNFTGLLALKGWLSELNTGRGQLGPELASLCEVFLGDRTGFEITVQVDENHAAEAPPDFAAAAADRYYLERRDGSMAKLPPARFSELEDNPFRNLASETRAKVTRTGPKRRDFELSTRDAMVWVKGPRTAEYIEFPIAKVFAQTLTQAGLDYDGRSPLKRSETALLRHALQAAVEDPEHPMWDRLRKVVVVPKGVETTDELHDRLKVTRKKSKVRLRRSRMPV